MTLVQDGNREAGDWICPTCNLHWDDSKEVWLRSGVACTRTADEAAAAAPTPAARRLRPRCAEPAAAAAPETPTGNGLAAVPAAPQRESRPVARFAPADPDSAGRATGYAFSAPPGGDLHPATAREQLAARAPGCKDSVPSFLTGGRGGYRGRVADMKPSTRRAARASAAVVLTGAASLVLPQDPQGAMGLAFTESVRQQAKALKEAARQIGRATSEEEAGSIYEQALSQLEDGQQLGTALAEALAQLQRAVSRPGRGKKRAAVSTRAAAETETAAKRAKSVVGPLVSGRGGAAVLGALEGRTPLDRRPDLAWFARSSTRVQVSQALDEVISKREWSAARNHALHPGPGQPVIRYVCTAMRVKKGTMESLLSFLERGDILQTYAYGEKVAQASTGLSVRLDAVDRLMPLQEITAQFLEHLDGEMELATSGYVEPECRCAKQHHTSHRRCTKAEGHRGSCKFTPNGSMSAETIRSLVSSMTMGDVKSLSGLDDIATVQGYENFRRFKDIIGELGRLADVSGSEKAAAEDERARTELFHKVHFRRHLQRTGTTLCSCLACNFHGEAEGEQVPCPSRGEHTACCEECVRGFDLLSTLHTWVGRAKQRQLGPVALDQLHELEHELGECEDNFVHYRGHLARKHGENGYKAARRLAMPEDTVELTSDYKKKILEAKFRENMKAWYAKTGKSMLGFMALGKDGDDYKLMFYMLFTDDSTQDAPSVLAAKTLVLIELLPKDFPGKSRFWWDVDGAGCFAGNVMHAAQLEWHRWTGWIEEENHVDVTGDGKTDLDGQFSVVAGTLATSLDSGLSYNDADTLLAAATARGGHRATVFGTYASVEPDVPLTVKSDVDLTGYPLVKLERGDEENPEAVTGLRGWKHSGYGDGKVIAMLTAALAHSCTCSQLHLLTAALANSCTCLQLHLLTAALAHSSTCSQLYLRRLQGDCHAVRRALGGHRASRGAGVYAQAAGHHRVERGQASHRHDGPECEEQGYEGAAESGQQGRGGAPEAGRVDTATQGGGAVSLRGAGPRDRRAVQAVLRVGQGAARPLPARDCRDRHAPQRGWALGSRRFPETGGYRRPPPSRHTAQSQQCERGANVSRREWAERWAGRAAQAGGQARCLSQATAQGRRGQDAGAERVVG